MAKPQFKLEHVERLTRGKRSGVNIGSRAVSHHLRPHERRRYERAKKTGYLELTVQDRENLWHVWEKVCAAKNWHVLVLMKDTANAKATIHHAQSASVIHGAKVVQRSELELSLAKQEIRHLAQQLNLD
jgi:ribosomal protein S25